jgi:hypothetical protein
MIVDRTWTYDTVKSVGYRQNTPGSISEAELECDYFYLRALVKNRDRVRCEAYRRHLARESRRAMGRAFTDAPAARYAELRELAWEYLPPAYRLFYGCATVWPSVARAAIRAKRRMRGIPPSLAVDS